MAKTWKPDPTGWRTERMPVGWAKIRAPILERDNRRCTWIKGEPDGGNFRDRANLNRCPNRGSDVDHIGAHNDHSEGNLRTLCVGHHRHRSSVQANAAKKAKGNPRLRPTPRHPGLIA